MAPAAIDDVPGAVAVLEDELIDRLRASGSAYQPGRIGLPDTLSCPDSPAETTQATTRVVTTEN